MSLIINGSALPITGNVSYNGHNIDEVCCNGIQVWKKQTSHDVPPSSIEDYVSVSGNLPQTKCSTHNTLRFDVSVWYCTNGPGDAAGEWVIAPKAPYTKIKATFHQAGGLIHAENDSYEIRVNGVNINTTDVIVEGSSLRLTAHVHTSGWSEHWQTAIYTCMRDIVVSN